MRKSVVYILSVIFAALLLSSCRSNQPRVIPCPSYSEAGYENGHGAIRSDNLEIQPAFD